MAGEPMNDAKADLVTRLILEPAHELSIIPTKTEVSDVTRDIELIGRHIQQYVRKVAEVLASNGANALDWKGRPMDVEDLVATQAQVFDDLAFFASSIAEATEERERTYAMEARG